MILTVTTEEKELQTTTVFTKKIPYYFLSDKKDAIMLNITSGQAYPESTTVVQGWKALKSDCDTDCSYEMPLEDKFDLSKVQIQLQSGQL